MKVNPDGTVITNVIDTTPNYISRFYTPKLVISSLSSNILSVLNQDDFFQTNRALSESTLTMKFLKSSLKLESPFVYTLAQTTILEAFALLYSLKEKPELMKYIDTADVNLTRQNVKYLLDYLGDDERYSEITIDLQSMDVALGYVGAQIPLIKKELRNNGTL